MCPTNHTMKQCKLWCAPQTILWNKVNFDVPHNPYYEMKYTFMCPTNHTMKQSKVSCAFLKFDRHKRRWGASVWIIVCLLNRLPKLKHSSEHAFSFCAHHSSKAVLEHESHLRSHTYAIIVILDLTPYLLSWYMQSTQGSLCPSPMN